MSRQAHVHSNSDFEKRPFRQPQVSRINSQVLSSFSSRSRGLASPRICHLDSSTPSLQIYLLFSHVYKGLEIP